MKKFSISALVAAGLLAGGMATSASAADLGGDCCADLEERIAELEATTARKGNRKVSLTVSGWVAEQITWYDDGVESNVYVEGIGTTLSSNVKFTGGAQINSEWSAGYVLHLEAKSNDTLVLLNQNTDDAGQGIGLLQSYWFLKSERLGKVGIGLQSQASDNTAILVDGSGSLVPANWVMFEGAGFFARRNGNLVGGGYLGNVTYGDFGYCYTTSVGIGGDCNGATLNSVRYDSPTFGGFSVSASWGEDDFWDVAARYAGEHNGFKLAVAAAYTRTTDNTIVLAIEDNEKEVGYFQVGAYLQHLQSGLFVYGAYGVEDVDTAFVNGAAVNAGDGNQWMIKAGLRRQFNPLGHTVLYGFYQNMDDMYSSALALGGATGSEMDRWGLGVVQEVDAAAMSLWLQYQQYDPSVTVNGTKVEFDEIDMIKFGALINF